MKALAAVLALASSCCLAQTEADILSYAQSGQAELRAGRITALEFNRELYRRVELTPGSTYRFKAENLRFIGRRIDILEDVQAGRITPEKGQRMLAEQLADGQAADQSRVEAARAANAQADAQAEAQRRALALQMLQNRQQQPLVPLQPLPPMNPAITCRTYPTAANQTQTDCR